MSKWYKISFVLFIVFFLNSQSIIAAPFPPVPQEDHTNGRNSNAYLPSKMSLTNGQRDAFVQEVSTYAVKANEKWGIPASAIIGMAVLESGFGTTRTAYHANNIFGIKVWGFFPANAWQLVGQPDEDFERNIPVISNFGTDRIIFDERQRRDNWYRKFSSYEESVNFLAGTLLLNQRYGFARENYQQRLKAGWSMDEASKRYVFEIANAGYNHLGGDYYRRTIGKIMDDRNLYRFDVGSHLRDAKGHWAEAQIFFGSEKGWMNGFNDGTFRPDQSLTRAQAATVLVNFLPLKGTNRQVAFDDVTQSHWARSSIILVAQNEIMRGTAPATFSPNTTMTRAQVVQALYNAGLYSQASTNSTSSFSDVPNNHWALQAIETMRQEGVVSGFGDGTFRPNEPVTRAQMAVIIKNVYDKQNK